jgi:hypothetical protein
MRRKMRTVYMEVRSLVQLDLWKILPWALALHIYLFNSSSYYFRIATYHFSIDPGCSPCPRLQLEALGRDGK